MRFWQTCVFLTLSMTAFAQTEATVHYHRTSGDYAGWGLHLWGSAIATSEATTWASPKLPTGDDAFGKVFTIQLADASQAVNFIMHKGNDKDTPDDRAFTPSQNAEIWLIQGDATIYTSNPFAHSTVTVHYQRTASDYTGWGLHLWGDALDPAELTAWASPRAWDGDDTFGKYATINLDNSAATLNFIVHKGNDKDTPNDRSFIPNDSPEIWLRQGDATIYTSNPDTSSANTVRIHYRRGDGVYTGWGLHLYGDAIDPSEATTWPTTKPFAGSGSYGVYADVLIADGSQAVSLIVHNNGAQDVNATSFVPDVDGYEVWLASGSSAVYTSEADGLAAANKIFHARARWATQDTIGWQIANAGSYSYTLYVDPEGDIQVDGDTVTTGPNGASYALSYGGDFSLMDPTSEFYSRFAYLKNQGFSKISVPAMTAQQLKNAVRSHLVIVARNGSTVIASTSLQRAGVLDENYLYNGSDLGLTINAGSPNFKLWAPTAKSVTLHRYADSTGAAVQSVPMTELADGIWAATGAASWLGDYYLYEVEVFDRRKGSVVNNMATDPYSISLSTNSTRSHIVDLDSAALKPSGWDTHTTTEYYPLEAPEDITIYELHVRDFSMSDTTVPVAHRGKYKAFSVAGSTGMNHLDTMARSGLTHVHLLPVNDIKSVNEDVTQRVDIQDDIGVLYPGDPRTGQTIEQVMAGMGVNSTDQQAIAADMRGIDGFNWGYDPYHFFAPEGSYATDPDGSARILEFREMVQSLHQTGLRLVVDVVYNHTFDPEIFERVVPDYYYRLNHEGDIENSSCCPDTASENKMFEKLVADSVVLWAKHYKVDSFRFDLMGHLTLATMDRIRNDLDALTVANDGIDGSEVYLYGEGWDFGSLRWLLPDSSAYQFNVTGRGIGTFNDRFRDSIKGKGQNPNELFVDDAFLTDKLTNRDQVLGSMRGTLWDYYGYVTDPQESINYLSAHDKATLWDQLLAKVGNFATLDELTKMQNLGVGLIALSQGVPFFHAGIEILRSKSGDENSYDSGDWFNKLDYASPTNHWAKGLPPGWQSENIDAWDEWTPMMSSIPTAGATQIDAAFEHFTEMLEIRKSSKLFRLRTMGDIQQRVSFPAGIWNDATNAFDGRLVVMKLSDFAATDIDPSKEVIWVLVNTAWDTWLNFYDDDVKRSGFELHPVLQNTDNPYLDALLDGCCTGAARATAFSDHSMGGGKISVPPQTVLVYWAD